MQHKRPKDHHIVPEMHLKHFMDHAGQIWTYDKERTGPWSTVPRETATQRNFYSMRDDSGFRDDIEFFLSQIETAAAPIYHSLLGGQIPKGSDRTTFSLFVGSMFARSPAA